MSLEIKYSHNGAVAEVICSGRLAGNELIRANEELYSEELVRHQKLQIVDFTAVSKLDVSNTEIVKLAVQDVAGTGINPDIYIVLIVPTDLEFGLARMWEVYTEESTSKSRIFRDRESADIWIRDKMKILGLEP